MNNIPNISRSSEKYSYPTDMNNNVNNMYLNEQNSFLWCNITKTLSKTGINRGIQMDISKT
jgi:hypothetical protein